MRKIFFILFAFYSINCFSQNDTIHVNPGSGSGQSSNIGQLLYPSPQAVLFDSARYNAFPVATIRNGIPRVFIKSSTSHAATGFMLFTKYESGNWSVPKRVTVDGSVITCATLCVGGDGDRTYMAYQVDTPYNSVSFAYNDNADENFTSAGSVNKRSGEIFVSMFGKIERLSNGEIWIGCYAADADNSYGYFMKTTNNGASWSVGKSIWTSDIDGIPAYDNGSLSELYWKEISPNKMICVARNDSWDGGGAHNQFSSDDLGDTWTRLGLVTNERTSSDGGNPMSLWQQGDELYAIVGQRETVTDGGMGYMFNIAFLQGLASEVYDDPTKWSKKRFIYKPITGYKSNGADFGYPEPFTYGGIPYVAFYDHSSNSQGVVDDKKRERVIIYPLLDNNYYEGFNPTNQTITTSGSVSFPEVYLDGVGYGDSTNKIVIPENGYYQIGVHVLFDTTNTTGTYRKIDLQIIDPGAEIQGTYFMRYEISKSIAPNASSTFTSIDLNSIPYFFNKGFEVRVIASEDATGTVSIINTIPTQKATISISKIQQ